MFIGISEIVGAEEKSLQAALSLLSIAAICRLVIHDLSHMWGEIQEEREEARARKAKRRAAAGVKRANSNS